MSEKTKMIREVRLFEFYIKFCWPLHRVFIRGHLTPRCKKCILPETYSPLENGVCKICGEDGGDSTPHSKSDRARMQQEMDDIVKAAQARDDVRFHILLLFSGGKDSSYLLHKLLQEHPGARILALTVDNTFMSPVAMENVQEIVKRLGVDHMVFRPRAETMEKMFRHAFTHLNERGCAGTVDQFDGDFFTDAARNIAAEMNIPLVFRGLSRTQVEEILNLDSFVTTPEMDAESRSRVAGVELREIFDDREMSYWWNGPKWPADRRPRMLFPFYIWDMEEEFIKSEVLRLKLTPGGDVSPLITNNRLIPLMGIVDMVQFGYSSFEPEFARMVRAGKADRLHWLYSFETLEYAARTGRFLGDSIDEVLQRLSLARQDLGMGA